MATEKATFAAGCFWGVEHKFRQIKGVIDAEVGYTGGKVPNPTYPNVCGGHTGHAEAVRLFYDSETVTYAELLDAFFAMHDPTQVNRQGPDVGTQYRSAVFFHSAEQEAEARAAKERLAASGRLRRPVATQIVEAGPFWRAEEYHQRYIEKAGGHSCAI